MTKSLNPMTGWLNIYLLKSVVHHQVNIPILQTKETQGLDLPHSLQSEKRKLKTQRKKSMRKEVPSTFQKAPLDMWPSYKSDILQILLFFTLNVPFAASNHMVQKRPYWRSNCPLGHLKWRKLKLSCIASDVPRCNLLFSKTVFVPCDRQPQRTHFHGNASPN